MLDELKWKFCSLVLDVGFLGLCVGILLRVWWYLSLWCLLRECYGCWLYCPLLWADVAAKSRRRSCVGSSGFHV